MKKKNINKGILMFFFSILLLLLYFTLNKKDKLIQPNINAVEENLYNSNIIKDVNYVSKDAKGNEYIIDATEGEIDLKNTNVIFLTDVRAFIKLTNSNLSLIHISEPTRPY